MSKLLLGAAFVATSCIAATLAGSEAEAMGGGLSPPWTSPYAILEPQTVTPQSAAPFAAQEGRSAYIEKDGAHPHATRHSRRPAPAAEQ